MIVIPMAGLSNRFKVAGYDLPKFMLPLDGQTVFHHAISSFSEYFDTVPFLFIARGNHDIESFVTESSAALGIRDTRVQMLRDPTAGQAETVGMGLDSAGISDETPLTIFNIDTFRPNLRFPDESWSGQSDGYLEVFRGSGNNWSYVRPAIDESHRVLETAEKRAISDLCCTGLYHFQATRDFRESLAHERANPSTEELYVAPLYNHLIRLGRIIHYEVIAPSEIVFCGIPAEYEALAVRSTVGGASD
jgi:hypothetical protein